MPATLPQELPARGTTDWLRHFPFLRKFRWGEPVMTAGAAYLEVSVTKPPLLRPLVTPRASAEGELKSLLDEIPTWSDTMLVHMHKRFATSRLFRVHHDPQGALTARAVTLRAAVGDELSRRGLPLYAD
jgi:hypothetical protein